MPSQTLCSGWTFSQVASKASPDTTEEWLPCSVPTSVHVELQKLGKIPDFHKGLAEWDIQWIQEADWSFKTTFDVTKEQLSGCADLVFEGLDTFCDIILNGKLIASTDNMFIPHRVAVKEHLAEGSNELELKFASPLLTAKEIEAANGGPRGLWNGESNRLYARKAQYGWGWDWGPIVMTVGPWRPVVLETYQHRLEARVEYDLVGSAYDTAVLAVSEVEVSPKPEGKVEIQVTLTTADGKVVKQTKTAAAPKWELKVPTEVEAWFPIGYGKQPLYNVEVAVVNENGVLASTSQRVAFRHAKVVEEPLTDQPGTSFLFEVNGVRVFCGGSNWIPADNYFTQIKPERYRKWVELLVSGNQNMLRVWGGGIYEDEELYNACDELGVLVWQDFMFGCGIYPSYPKINANIKHEAELAVARLRRHPSVVILCGNNEDYMLAERDGLMDWNDNSGDYMNSQFPGRHIYEILLPEVVERCCTVHYHRSSPYGGKDTKDQTIGDIHQWNVWHGTQEPWSNWDKLAGRFVSEFGMQGYPNIRTVKEFFSPGEEDQCFPQSQVSINHNKGVGFERRIELYLMENFRHAFDMESYVYYTQVMQAETLGAAYRLWRREWRGKGKEYTAGALVWQLNDCWPCVSWAICDYYLRPKPAFFTIARELKPYTVGMARKEIKTMRDAQTSTYFTLNDRIDLWACNSTLEPKKATVELISVDLHEGEVDRRTFDVELAPNSSTEIWVGNVPGQPERTSKSQVPKPIVVGARLMHGETVLARYANWPEPWKYLTFPEVGLRVDVDGDSVTLSCERPIKGIILEVEGEYPQWSDQAIDLMPGDPQTVTAKGLNGRKVQARYLGDGSA